MENISISLSEGTHDKDVSEIRVDGVIDTLTAGELEQVIDSLLKRERYRIVIDLAGVEYISSAGWGIFISHIRDVRAKDGDIKLAGMVPDVYEIFELLEFDNVRQTYPTVDAAMTAFGVDPGETSKKKVRAATRLAIVDAEQTATGDNPGSDSTLFVGPEGLCAADPSVRLLAIVREDPFATIGQIAVRLRAECPEQRVGRWGVFRMLCKHRLLTRRARFRLAWQRG